MWVRYLDRDDPLEEGMAARSSILAWRIPWTGESGRLKFMGSQRVRHDQSNFICKMSGHSSLPQRVVVRTDKKMWEKFL